MVTKSEFNTKQYDDETNRVAALATSLQKTFPRMSRARSLQIAEREIADRHVEIPKKFSVRLAHDGRDPLGSDIGPDHSFWTMTSHVSGPERDDMKVGDTCLREATTADGRHVVRKNNGGSRTEWIRYSVGRVE